MGAVTVYCDGSCDNKNKSEGGGIGIHMEFNGKIKEVSEYVPAPCTSATCEIIAAIRVLEICRPSSHHITIHSDNRYVVDTVEKGWYRKWIQKGITHTKANIDLWERFFKAYYRHKGKEGVTLKWVKGHAGIELNEVVDKLANEGRLKGK